MYLLFDEWQESWTANEITDDDWAAQEEGVLDIFKFEDGKFYRSTGRDAWLKVKAAKP